MADLTTRLADRRCPDCDALQPLFMGREGSKRVWQRKPEDVVPCPDCSLPLRLGADLRDPAGHLSLGLMVGLIALGGAVAVGLWRGLALPDWALGAMLLAVAAGVVIGSPHLNARAARRRAVLRVG